MNAAEARKLSAENSQRLALDQLKKVINELENKIKDRVNRGHYEARIEFYRTPSWTEHENTSKLEDYFRVKGFKTETSNYLMTSSSIFKVYWNEEEE